MTTSAVSLRTTRTARLLWLVPALLASCTSSKSPPTATSNPPSLPSISTATFSNPTGITHPRLGFTPLVSATYATRDSTEFETIVIERLATTRIVMGIECAVVRDRAYSDGLLMEDTHDWYAQDDAGNVWYMGEEVINFEYDPDGNLLGTNSEGAWEAGLDVAGIGRTAQPGFLLPANPAVGDFYYQEFYPGIAVDAGRVISLNSVITLADGSTHGCVEIEDTTALEPGLRERKFFAPGLGVVSERVPGTPDSVELRGRFDRSLTSLPPFSASAFASPSTLTHPLFSEPENLARVLVVEGDDEFETIVVERLPGTRSVFGIECAIVRDRVFADGNLEEDTHDWFAQDDDGNVWYMGEEVVNYEYDEEGNLLGTNTNGSWEAGLDIAGVGEIALPGHQIRSTAVLGVAYYQEYYPTEAEDMSLVVSDDAEVELPSGEVLTGCVQVLDWNPIDPDGLEHKFYAPGRGFVLEAALHEPNTGALVAEFDRSAASIPNFAQASFTMSTLIDNTFFPLPPGATWDYESETEDGLETIHVEVLPQTRLVDAITCLVVRDTVRLEGVLIEDTFDWFAQDDSGNVWYMGEEVTNYVYDENGILIETNSEGSWEAGLDVAGVGSIALPGYQMLAAPTAGTQYYQEYYLTAAEDMGLVVGTDVEVTLPGGQVFTGCVRTVDWNPLDPETVEYKYYAPGIGFVFEEKATEDEELGLTATSL